MKRGKFSLSNYKLLSCNMGALIPIGLTEVLPGDTIQQATSALLRCSPLLAPVMHPVHVRIHHWYVPHRLVWEDFEDFITGGPDGMDTSEFPVINNIVSTAGSLADYYGIPPGVTGINVSAIPFRGYAKIFNEWYRDQDLTAELVIDETSGPDTTTNQQLAAVAWEKDYFTSARPWEMKGPSITIPIGTTAPVIGSGDPVWFNNGVGSANLYMAPGNQSVQWDNVPGAAGSVVPGKIGSPQLTGYMADLSNASAVTLSAFREALALGRFEEARARYGSRYVEYLRYLGVRSSDARLNRPEYLGGGKQTIQFSEVLQTAEGTETAVGEMRGHGIAAMRSNRYRRFIEEHGYIHSFISVRPKTIYTQGIHRTWLRRSKEDFWQRELQTIGQQEIYNQEVYAASVQPGGTFGWQDRYDEYRRSESSVAGNFRNTLDFWHFARSFASEPALNSSFVLADPTKRTFAVPSEDVLYIMANHSIQARRLIAQTGHSSTF